MLRPPRACSTLGRDERMRVPCPAAKTTTAATVGAGSAAVSGWTWFTALLGRRRRRAAGGLGLEPRLPGSKGRRAADYPIPHPGAGSGPGGAPVHRRPPRA
ncbi:protein of unknown function [Blastococcus saxobsidens DD2]|uniref:Uncharacterized protein n=1 Tax=Blastococcus saxobsidens (strain DD2) TaxID=1146883 RepID=H6RRS0_BLASD|nr:protein of unknown function [Blastococcus saxobsidens DD2]